jgi:hypothetical protein
MRLTEEDAKTKWCPEGRLIASFDNGGAATFNRTQGRSDWPRCIGSACMFWRWSYGTGGFTREDRDGNSLGYCGAAGAP